MSDAKITKGPICFIAKSLTVDTIMESLVEIQIHDKPDIEVTINGTEDNVKEIKLSQSGEEAIIKGENQQKNIVHIVGTSLSGFIVVGTTKEDLTQILIRLPKGTPVNLADVHSKTKLGDIESRLAINQSTSGEIIASKVKEVQIDSKGSGKISIEEVHGDIAINTKGSGELNIEKIFGNIKTQIKGSGEIRVGQIHGNVIAEIKGSGDFKIRDGKISKLEAAIDGSGNFSFDGEADDADLSVRGSGGIKLAHVSNRPRTTKKGSGKIKIKNLE